MSFISVRKAKAYYKSHKNIMDKNNAGTPMHFNNDSNQHKALDLKPKKVVVLKGGLGK